MADRTSQQPGDPASVIAQQYNIELAMCDILERIADSLPDDVHPPLAAAAARSITIELTVHQRDQEEVLFPLLLARCSSEDRAADLIDLLTSEHATDAGFAAEVIEALQLLGTGRHIDNANMLGYMLRGFFQCYRRHLNWEQAVLLPLARQRLSSDDMAMVAQQIGKQRRQLQLMHSLGVG